MTQSWRPDKSQTIDALYAWVATAPDGGEGVCGASMPSPIDGRMMMVPLVGADLDRVKSLRDYAETTRKLTGYPVRLVRFAHREDIEVLP